MKRLLLCGASVVAVASVMPIAAFAQDGDVETVVVTGVRESLRDSLLAKKSAVAITENISIKDIGQLPDVTIAEQINRLPGINTSLDRGNASQASVRGLGPRLILGLVNGREVASSEPNQDIRWETYPSEVVFGVTVSKSQSADLVPGGIAATIDIKTLAPLDYSGPSLALRAGPTYNAEGDNLPHYDPLGFRGSASYITHINENLAVYVAASFQRQKNGYESFQGWVYNRNDTDSYYHVGDATGDGVADYMRYGSQVEIDRLQQDRLALAGAIDWKPTSNLRVKADLLFSDYRIHEDQLQQWYSNWANWTSTSDGLWGNSAYATDYSGGLTTARASVCNGWGAGGYGCVAGVDNANITTEHGVVVGGTTTAGRLYNVIALYKERHSLLVAGLNLEYTEGAWDVKVDASHSQAMRNNIWQDIITNQGTWTTSYYTGTGEPMVAVSGTAWVDSAAGSWYGITDPADLDHQTTSYAHNTGSSSGPEYTRDHLSAIQMDASRAISGSMLTEVDFGFRVSSRGKNHELHSYYLCPGVGASTSWCGTRADLDPDMLETYSPHAFNTPTMVYGVYEDLAPVVYGDTHDIAGTDQLSSHWKVKLTTYEGYLKAVFEKDIAGVPMTGNIGLRVVGTSTNSHGYACEPATGSTTCSTSDYYATVVKKNYTDVLPSMSLNFHLADDKVLRFGASIAMARPPIDELRVGNTLSSDTGSLGAAFLNGSSGNPTLNPYRADQVDLSYEWYFHDESMLAAAMYYKHLNSFIGYQSSNEEINGETYYMSKPVNGPGGDVTGLELTFQTRFYFIPVEFLQDFGVYANYAWVNSGVKEFTPAYKPLDATGLAKHTAELDLWYSAHGIEARLAYKIHSPYTMAYGWNGAQLSSADWNQNLDASVSYQISDNVNVRFQARNLTDEVWRAYWDNNTRETARYDVFGRTFLLDVTFHN